MKACDSNDGLTLRLIAGSYNALLGLDLQVARQAGCLGFSIHRTDLGPTSGPPPPGKPHARWLPNMLRFPHQPHLKDFNPSTSDISPLQNFRWGDWTLKPGNHYRYRVVAQYGTWDHLQPGPEVEVEVCSEDPANPATAVHFNRGAAASNAYNVKFGPKDPSKLSPGPRQRAYAWLSRGLEEAILAFLAQAQDHTYSLHAAIYEFEKDNLLQGLKQALDRGVDVQVVYHARPGGKTAAENRAAAERNDLAGVCVERKGKPTNAISHNKFVVLLKDGLPQAVWTGSTNWTEGAIYGQLNVGHALYDPDLAQAYHEYWQLLHADSDYKSLRDRLAALTPVPAEIPPGPGNYPIFSPQRDEQMLKLYAEICAKAGHLMVCLPFEVADAIQNTFKDPSGQELRFLLLDKIHNLGPEAEVSLIAGDTGNMVSVATTLKSPLHDFQNRLLEGQEWYHHAGVHIHSKIIAANPLSSDPTIVMGSANFSDNSTLNNDSNSVVIRGNTAVADIYLTEYMRVFEAYYFRGRVAQQEGLQKPLNLSEDDTWLAKFFEPGSSRARGRMLFAGTDDQGVPLPDNCP